MDNSPNPGKSTGGDKPPQKPATTEAGSSSAVSTPPPPPPPPPPANVPTVNVPLPVVTSTHARIITTTTPLPNVSIQANPGSAGPSGSRGPGGAEAKRASASSVIMYTGGSSVRRKRSRPDDDVGGSSSRPRNEGPGELVGIPSPCWVCGKQFGSWKALFGHMRSHPERSWRGVAPPPTFNLDAEGQPQHSQQQREIVQVETENDLAATLLNLAKGCLERIGGAGPSSEHESRIVFDVDLNVAWEPVMEEPEMEPPVAASPPPPPRSPTPPPRSPTPPPPPPSPARDGDGNRDIDLNKSPPEE